MTKYKDAYLALMRETEKAIELLIDAQQKCEEIFLEAENEGLEDDDENDPQIQAIRRCHMTQEEYEEAYELIQQCHLEMLKKSLAKERPE